MESPNATKKAELEEPILKTEELSPQKDIQDDWPIFKIFLTVNLAQMCYAMQQAIAKYMMTGRGVNPIHISFWRGIVPLLPYFVIMKTNKRSIFNELRRDQVGTLVIRFIIGVASFYAMQVGLQNLPLSISTVVLSTNPFFTAVIQYLWLGDPILFYEVFSMVGSFAGIALISFYRPSSTAIPDSDVEIFEPNYMLGIFASLFSSVGIGYVSVATKSLKNVHFSVLLTWYCLFEASIVGVVLFVNYAFKRHDEDVQVPLSYPDLSTYFLIVLTCLFHMVATSLMTVTTQNSSPSLVNLISYTGIIYNFLLDIFYFAIQFAQLQLVGITVVCGFNIGTVFNKRHGESKKNEEAVESDDGYLR